MPCRQQVTRGGSPRFIAIVLVLFGVACGRSSADELPKSADGRTLNLDFETGTLADWTAAGDAFAGQPIEGDTVNARRGDMHSSHQGKFWIGGYENLKDRPTGTLTSAPFVVTQPWGVFRIAGGPTPATRVEIVRRDSGAVVFSAVGRQCEDLEPVAVDLAPHQGKEIFIRLVDEASGGWGHLNFDDFRLSATKPNIPDRPKPETAGAQPGPPLPIDEFKYHGLPPAEAAKAMTLPPGFQATLFAGEPDVEQPIAMAIDDRGRLWIAEAYSYPNRVPADQARDRILIFEDTDNDGRFDSRKVFAEKLNLVSGLELGFGGVFVGAAPDLLFIPDADGDDRPDAPPQVVLDGWGYQDTHETLNSFIWGPDGWLYGCHGVFTHSKVGRPGTPDDQRIPINAGIWRFHPVRDKFEVFAHGTSNPWGVDFNDRGDCFLTACVIPHLFHVIQGGRYHRQAGSHFNPYTYDDIKTIAKHRHWAGGGSPHSGNNRSDSAGGGHAHSGAMIYLGDKWPAKYRDQIFMNNIHGARINQDSLTPAGSGYVGDRAPDFLLSNDSWSQLLYFTYGPDGDVYFIDWYDRQQCHRRENEVHDRSNGRIFKVTYTDPKGGSKSLQPSKPVDLKKLSDLELVELQLHQNDWYCRHARRILQERAKVNPTNPAARGRLEEIARTHADDTRRLRALWALHVTGGVDETLEMDLLLNDKSSHVRGWLIQLSCENGRPSQRTNSAVISLSESDASPVVRRFIASALPRLTSGNSVTALARLVAHSDDSADQNLPFLYWYAAESLVDHAPALGGILLKESKIDSVRGFTVRRLAQVGTLEALDNVLKLLPADDVGRKLFLTELATGLEGRKQVPMPESWRGVFPSLSKSSDPAVVDAARGLALTFGDRAMIGELETTLTDENLPADRRQAALAALVKARIEGLSAKVRGLLRSPALRAPAIRALATYDDPATPADILSIYRDLNDAEKRDAIATLSARLPYARALLDAVEAKTVASTDLSADLVRQLRNFKNPELDQRIKDVWGTLNDTPEERKRLITKYRDLVRSPGPPPDSSLGRAVFAKICAQCHTLFGAGGKIGPEITGANRTNLDYVLSNVVDPSALIGKDYVAHVLELADGRVLTGLIRNETPTALTITTATETVVLAKSDVETRSPSAKSMMPEDILKPLSDREVRSLVAYLAAPAQVPLAATPENAKTFFNGRDLAGWTGNPELWSVENGEIVGRSEGLKQNEFLVSDLSAGDFRLTVEVKLTENRGNSGVQVRSEPLPGGAVRGYQADVGVGWWGKLYEEHGRGLLWPESGESHVKSGGWNRYEIVCVGSRIRTLLNGKPCVELADPAGRKNGVFAFQLHSGGPTEVRFRNLKLELDPKWDFTPPAR